MTEENRVTRIGGMTGIVVGEPGERQVRYWVGSSVEEKPQRNIDLISGATIQLALFDAPVRTDVPQDPLF